MPPASQWGRADLLEPLLAPLLRVRVVRRVVELPTRPCTSVSDLAEVIVPGREYDLGDVSPVWVFERVRKRWVRHGRIAMT